MSLTLFRSANDVEVSLSSTFSKYLSKHTLTTLLLPIFSPASKLADPMGVKLITNRAFAVHVHSKLNSLPGPHSSSVFRFADDMEVKLAISFALAQSTKLSVFEERMRDSGKQLAYLPAMMAGEREAGW